MVKPRKHRKASNWINFKDKAVYMRWMTDKAELSSVGVIKEVIFLGYNLDGGEIYLLELQTDKLECILSSQVTWMEMQG